MEMWDRLRQYFAGRGFKETALNRPGMSLFYSANDTEARTVWMIDDEALGTLTPESYSRYHKTITDMFRARGFVYVAMLTLFVTDRTELSRTIGDGHAYWIVDALYGRLVVYEDQPGDFLGIRSVIENNLHFGGQSRNAEGAQFDINHDNFRGMGEEKPIERGEIYRVSAADQNRYLEEQARRKRLAASKSVAKKTCYITIALIVINAVLFLLTDFIKVEVLFRKGDLQWATAIEGHEFYRMVTCMFLHYGIDHFGGNMIALYLFGTLLEKRITRWHFVLLYFATGIFASVVSCAYFHYVAGYDPSSAGASGAIYGLMGGTVMYLLLNRNERINVFGRRFIFFLLYLAYGLFRPAEGVNGAAHMGGFVAGIVLMLGIHLWETRRKREWNQKLHDDE